MKKIFILILFTTVLLNSQTQYPKYEMRGVWVATVTNLDWPSSPNLTVDQQKAELITLFDKIKLAGANVIFFQVRTECDALYNSPYEPWSYWLTGTQGKAPNPMYDPLQMAIDEAHKRGMELHAWFNPYRAEKTVGNYPISATHIMKTHPEWVIFIGDYKFLNPGLPEVEAYTDKIVFDIVNRYNVDGIHMDDYFYPYSPNLISYQDTATYRLYNRGFSNIGDWRRDNINIMIKHLYDSLKIVKPSIKFGVSPFGIWKPNYPAGITGMDAYNTLYCDPIAWLKDSSIDYLTPQLYWAIGSAQDYISLAKWWADSISAHRSHFYPGLGGHNIPTTFSASELPNQIRFNRTMQSKIQGSVIFEGNTFLNNPKGFIDTLRNTINNVPALTPKFSWKEQVPPNAPTNLSFSIDPETQNYALTWTAPTIASDGDTAHRYAVYNFDHVPTRAEIDEGNHLFALSGSTKLFSNYCSFSNISGNYYVVTALDLNSNESELSNVIQINQPVEKPNYIYPSNGSLYQSDTVNISWKVNGAVGGFNVQISKDSLFTPDSLIVNFKDYKGTTYTLAGLKAQKMYYWRVSSLGFGGESEFGQFYSFKTAFPLPPVLKYPAHTSTTSTMSPTFIWLPSDMATSYRFQISTSASMSIIAKDTTVTDTTLVLKNLVKNKTYYWRVSASNQYGTSTYSSVFGFKTPLVEDVSEDNLTPLNFNLSQNYPNPFNPSTTITYALKEEGKVSLKIYDLLGNQILSLVDEWQPSGTYHKTFDASRLSSGVYFYKLIAKGFTDTKKMILIK